MGRGGIEPGVGRGAPATPPGAREAFPVKGLLPVPARGVRVGVFPENGLFPGRGPAGFGATGASASGAAAAAGAGATSGAGAGLGAGAAAAGAATGAGAAGAAASAAAAAGAAAAGAAATGAAAAGAAAGTGATDGVAAAGAAAAGAGLGARAGVGAGPRRTLEDDDVRRGAADVADESAPSDARNLRATGASTVEEAERANSPMSLSFSRTCLLSSPSSFASS